IEGERYCRFSEGGLPLAEFVTVRKETSLRLIKARGDIADPRGRAPGAHQLDLGTDSRNLLGECGGFLLDARGAIEAPPDRENGATDDEAHGHALDDVKEAVAAPCRPL